MKRYREERARECLPEEPLGRLAESIVTWIRAPERRQGAWVAGLWGGRGTGKTSLLITVLERLWKEPDEERSIVAPTRPHKEHAVGMVEQALFAPGRGRADDALMFLLLEHIEKRYLHGFPREVESALAGIRERETRRYEPARFFDYEKEIATSTEEMPKRAAALLHKMALATGEIRDQFGKLLGCLQGLVEPRKPVLLLIDDLDLQPHRSLELLETIELFLRHDGVIVLIAADRELMLESLSYALRESRGIRQESLPGALLAKLVPYGWSLPLPYDKARLDEVWDESTPRADDDPRGDDELPAWWPERIVKVFQDPQRESDPPGITARDIAASRLTPLLPSTYRGLVAYHNRLISWRELLTAERDAALAEEELARVIHRRLGAFGLYENLAPPLFSALAALDVRRPELGLLDEVWNEPQAASEAVARVAPRPSREDEAGGASVAARRRRERTLDKDPWFTRLLSPLGRADEPSRLRADARADLQAFASFVTALRHDQKQVPIAERFFAISMNADAIAMSESEWKGRFGEQEVRAWHLDLRRFAEPDAPSIVEPGRLQEAYRDAIRFVEQNGIRSFHGRIEIFSRAKPSLILRLGHELRFSERVIGLNFYRSTFRRFSSPVNRVVYLERNSFDLLRCDPPLRAASAPRSDAGDAIVLLDLLGRSTPEQLERFYGDSGRVSTPDAYRLHLAPGSEMQPDQLAVVLGDVIELFGRLREERAVKRVHLGYAGADVVAFFLGQQLHAQGFTLSLYEFFSEDGGLYRYVFDLEARE